MREFLYEYRGSLLLTPNIVRLLNQIHEYKGRQYTMAHLKPESLTDLIDVARIQSTEASNRIEGITTTDHRLRSLVLDKVEPRNRNESEIAGYRDVLALIDESYIDIKMSPGVILQLHRELYRYTGFGFAGKYKNADNVIEERDDQGNRIVRFQPMAAFETPEGLQRVCQDYEAAINEGSIDPLLIIVMTILDFLCIHPFNDGNGRISRLLTLLLLYQNGYTIGKYISIEKQIEKTKETYYDALRESSRNWHQGTNDPEPFVEYSLGVILSAYKSFESSVDHLYSKGISKYERIRLAIQDHLGPITKKDIKERCPDISETTIEKALGELLKLNTIRKVKGGRGTAYVYSNENHNGTKGSV